VKLIHRLLLVWLLLLALPFQGIASASMLARMPSVPMSLPAAGHGAHCAGMAKQDVQPRKHVGNHLGAKTGSCARSCARSCADCCAGATMAPAALPALVPAPPHFISIPFRAGHVPSVDLALPDRPPRTALA